MRFLQQVNHNPICLARTLCFRALPMLNKSVSQDKGLQTTQCLPQLPFWTGSPQKTKKQITKKTQQDKLQTASIPSHAAFNTTSHNVFLLIGENLIGFKQTALVRHTSV